MRTIGRSQLETDSAFTPEGSDFVATVLNNEVFAIDSSDLMLYTHDMKTLGWKCQSLSELQVT